MNYDVIAVSAFHLNPAPNIQGAQDLSVSQAYLYPLSMPCNWGSQTAERTARGPAEGGPLLKAVIMPGMKRHVVTIISFRFMPIYVFQLIVSAKSKQKDSCVYFR